MTIVEFLKSEYGTRVSCGNRWLVWDIDGQEWVVYEHLPYAKKTTVIIHTLLESTAIKALRED